MCSTPGFLCRLFSAWGCAWAPGMAEDQAPLCAQAPLPMEIGLPRILSPFPQTQGWEPRPGPGHPGEGPSGRSQGCGFGWGQWPLRAQHLEAIRPGVGVGVGLQERAGKGDMPSRGHTQAYPLGAMALGTWAHRPRCRLYLPPTPLSLQPHPLPQAAFSLTLLATSLPQCNHMQ